MINSPISAALTVAALVLVSILLSSTGCVTNVDAGIKTFEIEIEVPDNEALTLFHHPCRFNSIINMSLFGVNRCPLRGKVRIKEHVPTDSGNASIVVRGKVEGFIDEDIDFQSPLVLNDLWEMGISDPYPSYRINLSQQALGWLRISDIEVLVPPETVHDLDLLNAIEANVEALGLTGDILLKADNGNAAIRTTGRADIDLSRGSVQVESRSAKVSVDEGTVQVSTEADANITADGRIEVTAAEARIRAGEAGVKGHIRGYADVEAKGPIALRLGGGGTVTATGDASVLIEVIGAHFNTLDVSTQSGTIEIRLPTEVGYTVEAKTEKGTLEVRSFGDRISKGGAYDGDLGDGGAVITITSADGDVTVLYGDRE